jgi:2-phosphosulfolactate phosphatase
MSTSDSALPSWAAQAGYDVRFEWGPVAAAALTGGTCIVVDVLRFATTVEAAVTRGVTVFPYRWRDDAGAAGEFAESVNAVLPARGGRSLSPVRMASQPRGTSLVLPSPNGSTCAVVASEAGARIAAGCLRNAAAVGAWASSAPKPVTVIACGERWPDGSLRPALEDLLGAGAILANVAGTVSPEARAAVAAFRDAEADVLQVLRQCASGRELTGRGLDTDIEYAAQVNVSAAVPVLTAGAFRGR